MYYTGPYHFINIFSCKAMHRIGNDSLCDHIETLEYHKLCAVGVAAAINQTHRAIKCFASISEQLRLQTAMNHRSAHCYAHDHEI